MSVAANRVEDTVPGTEGAQRSIRVLVVDDSEDATEVVGLMLEHLGCEHERAHSGTEALQAFEARRPDVVLLDLGLPDIDGCSVASQMRKLDPRSVLVALTGYGDDLTLEAAGRSGFAKCLLKPLHGPVLEELMARVRDVAQLDGKTG